MQDKDTGISIRFIRAFDKTKDLDPENDPVLLLACQDERDVSFMQKLFDARTFIQSRKVQP